MLEVLSEVPNHEVRALLVGCALEGPKFAQFILCSWGAESFEGRFTVLRS